MWSRVYYYPTQFMPVRLAQKERNERKRRASLIIKRGCVTVMDVVLTHVGVSGFGGVVKAPDQT